MKLWARQWANVALATVILAACKLLMALAHALALLNRTSCLERVTGVLGMSTLRLTWRLTAQAGDLMALVNPVEGKAVSCLANWLLRRFGTPGKTAV